MSSLFPTPIPQERLQPSRNGLHVIGEWLLAGPQYLRVATIRLRINSAGVVTKDGLVAMTGTELISNLADADLRVPLQGSVAAIGDAAGIQPSVPQDLYSDHAALGVSDELQIDDEVSENLLDWFRTGDAALRTFASSEEPILWPEHFDVSIGLDEVNYGISLGDSFHPQPYAYVGPWKQRKGDFWNAPFGAVRSAATFEDAEAVVAFLAEGRARAKDDPTI